MATGMIWKNVRSAFAALAGSAALLGCGTNYVLPEPDTRHMSEARSMFAEARAAPPRPQVSGSVAKRRFNRVTARIKPVAESYCLRETADRPNFNCNVRIGVDSRMKERNAYFTYEGRSRPVIMVTESMLRDMQNDHELAFVLSHEYGHLIGRHIQKRQQQAMVGALIMGGLTALVPDVDEQTIADNLALGASVGSLAYSQAYELESDTLGTLITRTAGYDPTVGARFFARSEAPRLADGRLSFWGTHPPDAKRIATILATVERLKQQGELERRQ